MPTNTQGPCPCVSDNHAQSNLCDASHVLQQSPCTGAGMLHARQQQCQCRCGPASAQGSWTTAPRLQCALPAVAPTHPQQPLTQTRETCPTQTPTTTFTPIGIAAGAGKATIHTHHVLANCAFCDCSTTAVCVSTMHIAAQDPTTLSICLRQTVCRAA